MKASIVDLRYKTKQVLQALARNEEVTVLYHGKVKGIIQPVSEQTQKAPLKVIGHPFFGMLSDEGKKQDVLDELKDLRKPRYDI